MHVLFSVFCFFCFFACMSVISFWLPHLPHFLPPPSPSPSPLLPPFLLSPPPSTLPPLLPTFPLSSHLPPSPSSPSSSPPPFSIFSLPSPSPPPPPLPPSPPPSSPSPSPPLPSPHHSLHSFTLPPSPPPPPPKIKGKMCCILIHLDEMTTMIHQHFSPAPCVFAVPRLSRLACHPQRTARTRQRSRCARSRACWPPSTTRRWPARHGQTTTSRTTPLTSCAQTCHPCWAARLWVWILQSVNAFETHWCVRQILPTWPQTGRHCPLFCLTAQPQTTR